MRIAQPEDRERILEILRLAFEGNLSVGYICGKGADRDQRVALLMAYAYEQCSSFGRVLINEQGNACALVLFPDRRRLTLKSLYWDLVLVFRVLGWRKVARVMKREKRIKQHHPKSPFYYLWFIGVDPLHKGKGLGSELLLELMADARGMNRPFYLETSTVKNLAWYKRFGFRVYDELHLSYTLYFLKHEKLS